MIYTTEQIRTLTKPIAERYGLKSMHLFGSYARNQATESSDVDLLVERGQVRTAFQMGGLYLDLQDSLGKELDLVSTEDVHDAFLLNIRQDGIQIYP